MTRDFERPVLIRLFVAFLISTTVFVGIFVFAYSVSYLNYQYIVDQNDLIEESITYLETISSEFYCGDELLLQASEKLGVVGERLDLLEIKFGKKDERVLEQKKLYSVLEMRHIEIIKKYNEQCSSNYTTIFFFYSNINELEAASEKVAYILRSFKDKNPDKIMIYSFDYNLDSSLINDLKEKHEVDFVPYVVVNEGKAFYPKNIDDLEQYSN